MEFFDFASRLRAFIINFNSDVLQITVISLLLGAVCFLTVYVFESIALFVMAKKVNEKNKWMAFVPFVNTYYIGVLSKKNKVFGKDARIFSLALAIVELIYFVLSAMECVATIALAKHGYIEIISEHAQIGAKIYSIPYGLGISDKLITADLVWAKWMAMNIKTVFLSWIDLVYLVLDVGVLMAFFKTYAPERPIVFVILSIFFPVKGVLFYIMRNNKNRSYAEYIAEKQANMYKMYRQYYSNDFSSYGMNGAPNGRSYSSEESDIPDPFDDKKSTKRSVPDDPFDNFGK